MRAANGTPAVEGRISACARHGSVVLRLSCALVLLLTASSLCRAEERDIRIAAASDLSFAMHELAPQFERQTGCRVNVSYGSSGNFFSQLQNGAPFDLFLSADLEYPKRLEAAGLTDGRVYEYAVGRLALWAPANASVNPASEHWNALLDPVVAKIALANPDHAPYGRAAIAALKKAGVYDRVKAKLVFGENISQAAQFAQSGNVQAVILALSLARAPAMRHGKSWEIPPEFYPPIRQGAAVLRGARNADDARRFLAFLQSANAREILQGFGFSPPPAD